MSWMYAELKMRDTLSYMRARARYIGFLVNL